MHNEQCYGYKLKVHVVNARNYMYMCMRLNFQRDTFSQNIFDEKNQEVNEIRHLRSLIIALAGYKNPLTN